VLPTGNVQLAHSAEIKLNTKFINIRILTFNTLQ